MPRTAPAPLVPITHEQRWPNLRTGKTELWRAESADGEWLFVREEDGATTWCATHRTGLFFFAGTLDSARKTAAVPGIVDQLLAERASIRNHCSYVSEHAGTRTRCGEPPAADTDRCARHPRTSEVAA